MQVSNNRSASNLRILFFPRDVKGGAILAVLLLIPILTAGGIAVYKMSNLGSNTSLQAAGEEHAFFAAEGAMETIIGEVLNEESKKRAVEEAEEGSYVTGLGTDSNPRTFSLSGRRYGAMTALFVTKKVRPDDDAPPNTIALEIEARIYNDTSPAWNDMPLARKKIHQEFNQGIIKVEGCAANYDFFAAHDFISSQDSTLAGVAAGLMPDLSGLDNKSYYAGHHWDNCDGSFFDFELNIWNDICIDNPSDTADASPRIYGPWCIGVFSSCVSFSCADYCSQGSGASFFGSNGITYDCDATPITFGEAISTPGIDEINVNGVSNSYSFDYNYSLEKFVIGRISQDARSAATHDDAVSAMKSDDTVSSIENWYFRDADGNNLPDLGSPYFYHEGDLTSALPFSIDMFRFRDVYLYVDGNIKHLEMGEGSGFDYGKLYVVASVDIKAFVMMNMTMLDAGVVMIAGRDALNSNIMTMSGTKSLTILANRDVKLQTGFSFEVGDKTRILAGRDIKLTEIASVNFLINYDTPSSLTCGCTGTLEEVTELGLGKRYSVDS